ncbi:hypothetical protein C0J52_12659 [Blattella germanica]|nr:hypothetical protein C0J52_12659 [Blattella germanica]
MNEEPTTSTETKEKSKTEISGYNPGHKRTGSDVIDNFNEEVFGEVNSDDSRSIDNLKPPSNYNQSRRRSSDVVDCIGEPASTVVDGAEGQPPSSLDITTEQRERNEAWKKSNASSRDFIDATPVTSPEKTFDNDSRTSSIEAEMPVALDAEEYNMNHINRGHAIIFNHDTFDRNNYPPREGSEHDVKNLVKTFKSLGFEVTIHDNLTYGKIQDVISRLSEADHSNNDCLVVIVLTHGEAGGLLVPHDSSICYNVDMLWKPFTSDNCPTLAGKPKLFFIQACRGKDVDAGTLLKQRKHLKKVEHDSSPESYKIPTHADFLIAYSTAEGFYSFRNLDTGTWFIQCLCAEMNSTDNLLKILTRTTRRVTQLESDSDHPQFDKRKQVPSITTMLTRDLYFRPKK